MNKKRILAISDIHGHYDTLVKLLDYAEYNKDTDQLIILGDLCDRGTQNMATLFYARELQKDGAIVLMGNHDKVAIGMMDEGINGEFGLDSQLHVYRINGKNTHEEFMKLSDLDKKIARNFLRSLPLYYQHDKYIFVHSGVNANKPLEDNTEDEILWSRDKFYFNEAYEDKIVVFGHTPVKYLNIEGTNRIWFDDVYEDKIGIDCGCFFTGIMGCLEIDLETGKYMTYYIDEEEE